MKNNSGSDRCGANLMWNVNFINDQVSKSKYYCGDFISLEDQLKLSSTLKNQNSPLRTSRNTHGWIN